MRSVPGDSVVWARGLDMGRRYVECWYHSGVFLYVLLRMEDCAHWAGPRDTQAHCAGQILLALRAGRVHSLRRVLGVALCPGLAWHAGNGSARRAGGLDCAGAGVVGYQESSVEECAAGGDGGVGFGIVEAAGRQ